MITIRRSLFALLLLCFGLTPALADEIRPAYLQLTETAPDSFAIIWKLPAKGDKKLGLSAVLPDNCRSVTEPGTELVNGAYIERWLSHCAGGISAKTIFIAGLDSTVTDVMLRAEFIDGSSQSALLTPGQPSFTLSPKASSVQMAGTYTWLGITHILGGIDHLLFVFALLLIVNSFARLLWTITAFTLAHSITLAAATLKLVSLPQAPVEAVIALSILFLAAEILHTRQGRPGAATRWPWLVAFLFGLLHGFGFAGALAEVGLPQQAIPLALVFFNVGVELGQIAFIGVVLLLGRVLASLLPPQLAARGETVTVYLIGTLTSFWFLERVAAF